LRTTSSRAKGKRGLVVTYNRGEREWQMRTEKERKGWQLEAGQAAGARG